MATCKDCLHCEVCEESDNCMLTTDNSYELVYADFVEVSCNHFKDKIRYVELPCKVGNTFYHIEDNGNIIPYSVTEIIKNSCCIKVNLRSRKTGQELRGILLDVVFGKYLFRTEEEAEKALAERSANNEQKS